MPAPPRAAPRLLPVLRYPGGKQRLLSFLTPFLPQKSDMTGRYIEPFVGGAAVFLHLRPKRAVLSDANAELIDVYRAVKRDPSRVWRAYAAYGSTKRDYHRIRALRHCDLTGVERAARLLYLNRTCFKGNWRHNDRGEFNVGYGGQSRRWVISEDYLVGVSRALTSAVLKRADFEDVIADATHGDFLFLDPPYRRGERELVNSHYVYKQFTYTDHRRLAHALHAAARRGAHWAMTTSSHPDIAKMFRHYPQTPVPGGRDGACSGELLVYTAR